MKILAMKLVNHPLGIRIVLVEYEFTLAIPPEPILHNVVHGNVEIAIFAGDAENFFLRFIAVLALPETIRPLAEERSLSGKFAIAGNNFIQFRTVEEVVVDGVGDFGADIEIVGEAIVEAAARIVVPENTVAITRYQKGYGDVGVVLRDIDRLAAVVPHSRLVLTEPVESFARAVDIYERLCAIRIFAVYVHRS